MALELAQVSRSCAGARQSDVERRRKRVVAALEVLQELQARMEKLAWMTVSALEKARLLPLVCRSGHGFQPCLKIREAGLLWHA
jgi:hypothetical protein